MILSFIEIARAAATDVASQSSNTPIPSASPGEFVSNFYQLALLVGGILAFGAIVYGGIKYTLEAGNPSGKSEGKEWITQALLGLLLLLGAYIILNTINPNLTNLSLPSLEKITPVEATHAPNQQGFPNQGCIGAQCPANGCESGHCESLAAKAVCTSGANCSADLRMATAIGCLNTAVTRQGAAFQVTEAYPPTVRHDDPKHYNGCAVDIKITNYSGPADCAKVNKILANTSNCGLTSINEYADCGGKTFDTTTGQNIHLDGCR